MRLTTYDAIAAQQLLTAGQIKKSLLKEASAAVGEECPDCASTKTESNGSTEYRCIACDHRWGFDGGARGERYGF